MEKIIQEYGAIICDQMVEAKKREENKTKDQQNRASIFALTMIMTLISIVILIALYLYGDNIPAGIVD